MTTKSDLMELLNRLVREYPEGSLAFSTSFGKEDQAITHAITSEHLPIRIFTLDTGRLFEETYSVWNATIERLGAAIETYTPDAKALQIFLSKNGPTSFYQSVEHRLDCCHLRKVEPLQRALQGAQVWITGLRAGQSANRAKLTMVERDEGHGVTKVHPLLHWTDAELDEYLATHNIPVNRLHAKGFPSIGCAPCTRAVKPGEDARAGRWWWENPNKKECGLHLKKGEKSDA